MLASKHREQLEIAAYEKELAGLRLTDEDLVIPEHTIQRFRNPWAKKRFPVDLLFKSLGDPRGLFVLDCGCGDGEFSTVLGLLGARVTGVDLCEALVQTARRRARLNGIDRSVQFVRSSAHCLPFPANRFDLVFGKAVLHHLDLAQAASEFCRVLKKGGRCVFQEPIAFSKTLARIRRSWLVKALVRENRITPGERELTLDDLQTFGAHFSRATRHEVQLLSRLDRFVRPRKMVEVLNAVDIRLLHLVPALRKAGRTAIVQFFI